MNTFKSIALSLSFILGLATTNAFGMKRATPAPNMQETPSPTASKQNSAPSTKLTCGEYRDPRAKKEKTAEEPQLPMDQGDDDKEDTAIMADEQNDAIVAEITRQFATAGFFQGKRFSFLGRVAEAVAVRTAMNIVRTAVKDLNKTLAEMKLDFSDESTTL
ncbi:MAG: hypothetical protein WCS92_00430 [Candidatus Babeliales bacterium]